MAFEFPTNSADSWTCVDVHSSVGHISDPAKLNRVAPQWAIAEEDKELAIHLLYRAFDITAPTYAPEYQSFCGRYDCWITY